MDRKVKVEAEFASLLQWGQGKLSGHFTVIIPFHSRRTKEMRNNCLKSQRFKVCARGLRRLCVSGGLGVYRPVWPWPPPQDQHRLGLVDRIPAALVFSPSMGILTLPFH